MKTFQTLIRQNAWFDDVRSQTFRGNCSVPFQFSFDYDLIKHYMTYFSRDFPYLFCLNSTEVSERLT